MVSTFSKDPPPLVQGIPQGEGASIVERPISALDFMATICRILGINYQKQNYTPNGRPLRIVDKGAKPLTELFA